MIKFLAQRKFNYIDVSFFIVVNALFNTQQYLLCGVVLIVGAALSSFLEKILNHD